jgi:hypothetical protein
VVQFLVAHNTVMPLKLLKHKSWNVYNPAAIAKVRADEGAAAAREEAQNELELEWQADKRLALLRGDPEPPRPEELDEDVAGEDGGQKKKREVGDLSRKARDEKKRMRRRQGEDDTDRDLRIVKEDAKWRVVTSEKNVQRSAKADLPLVDAGGHIQLFAPKPTPVEKGQQSTGTRKDPEAIHRQKQQEQFEAGSMRFKEAGGNRSHPSSKPWYAGVGISSSKSVLSKEEEVGRNAFGKEDPNRKSRDAARVVSADPMQVMLAAQKRLKEVERGRERWKEEREREVSWTMDVEEKRSRRKPEGAGHGRRRERSRSRERYDEDRRISGRRERSRSPDQERSRHRHSTSHRRDRERR